MEMTTVQFVHFQFENLEASRLKTSCLNLCKLAMQADKGEQTEGDRLAKNLLGGRIASSGPVKAVYHSCNRHKKNTKRKRKKKHRKNSAFIC